MIEKHWTTKPKHKEQMYCSDVPKHYNKHNGIFMTLQLLNTIPI